MPIQGYVIEIVMHAWKVILRSCWLQ